MPDGMVTAFKVSVHTLSDLETSRKFSHGLMCFHVVFLLFFYTYVFQRTEKKRMRVPCRTKRMKRCLPVKPAIGAWRSDRGFQWRIYKVNWSARAFGNKKNSRQSLCFSGYMDTYKMFSYLLLFSYNWIVQTHSVNIAVFISHTPVLSVFVL